MDELFGQVLANNEFFQGGMILMLLGATLAYFRKVPRLIAKALKRGYTSSVQFREADIVHWFGQWLAAGKYAKRCRRLNGRLNHQGDRPEASLEPGLGTHYFRHNGRWVLLKHELEDDGEAAGGFFMKNRTMTVWILGRKPNFIRDMMEEAVEMALARRYGKQVAHINATNGNHWMEIKVDDKRPVESIVLPENMREEILADTQWFIDAGDWHSKRGLPYRRGYLFHGPPGNGKSTMIQVLAGHFELPIYMLSLSGKDVGDTSLYALMTQVPKRSILAIEDIDKIQFDRESGEGVTTAGLLNSIDGVVAGAGRILILTANNIEGLPAPLLRSGRIDHAWLFDTPGRQEIDSIFRVFYPDADGHAADFGAAVAPARLSMAAIQQHLVKCETPQGAIEKAADLVGSKKE